MALLAAVGAILAALVFIVPQTLSLLKARSTGVIVSKGYGGARIERAADPEKFRRFVRARATRLVAPFILLMVATVFLLLQLAAISAASQPQ